MRTPPLDSDPEDFKVWLAKMHRQLDWMLAFLLPVELLVFGLEIYYHLYVFAVVVAISTGVAVWASIYRRGVKKKMDHNIE